MSGSARRGSSRGARPRRRPRRVDCSARTASPSTSAAQTVTCPAGVSAPDPAGPQRRRQRDRLLRAGLRRVPAAGAVHHRQGRAHDQRRRARAGTGRCPRPPGRSRLGRRLPGDPPEGGTQARSPDAPPTRRTTSPGPRHRPGRRRLPLPRRRGQPRPPGHAPGPRNRHRMGDGDLTGVNAADATPEPDDPSQEPVTHP